jgi:hypothetical protein
LARCLPLNDSGEAMPPPKLPNEQRIRA